MVDEQIDKQLELKRMKIIVESDIKAKDDKMQGLVKKNEKLQLGLEKKEKDI